MKLRHPVIYSLVHIGAHGADVHKAPGTSFLRFRSSEAHPLSLLFSLVSDMMVASILTELSCHTNHESWEISGPVSSPLFVQEVIHL